MTNQTIKVIRNILESTLPDVVDGIHIKYDLREVPSLVYHDQKDCILTLMPAEIRCEDVAVSLRINPYTFPSDFNETSLAYKHLEKQIEEILMMYIKNVKKVKDDYESGENKKKESEWISVEDRLPKIGESVLVAVVINAKLNLPFRTDFTPDIRIGWLGDNGEWGLQYESADRDEILYWQPLPELPSKRCLEVKQKGGMPNMQEREGIEAFITEIKLRDALLKKALSEDPQLIVTEDELNMRKVNNNESS